MMEQACLWHIAAFCAFFVKGLCGFANTLVFTSILSFATANVNISPVELLIGAPTNLILIVKERKSLDLKLCLLPCLLVLLGSLPGILLLKNAETDMIRALFGLVTIIVGLEMQLRGNRQRRESGVLLGAISLLSGLLCGLFGVGALLGAYMGRVAKNMHVFKANLCAIFLTENILRIVLYAAFGILTKDIFLAALTLVPAMLIGMGTGMACAGRIDERTAKRIVVILLILSGAALIVKAF